MARDFAKSFYNSKLWHDTREYILMRDHYLCKGDGCSNAATEVHHIKHITPYNINDPNVTINEKNLISLCHNCHRVAHGKTVLDDEYFFDENGYLIKKGAPGAHA